MPRETVTLVEFVPGHQSEKSGKWVPAKVKDSGGREFTFAKDDKGKRLTEGGINAYIGGLADIEFSETQNGKFTNRVISEIAHRQEPGPRPVMATPPPPVEKPQGGGWKRDPAESSLILRQVALKAAVEWAGTHPTREFILPDGASAGQQPIAVILSVAEQFNDWLHERHDRPSASEQRAAQEALNTGGSYAEALTRQPHMQGFTPTLNKPPGRVPVTLKPGQNLKDAVAEVLANHDPLADLDDEQPPHPADTYGRETLKASGAPRR